MVTACPGSHLVAQGSIILKPKLFSNIVNILKEVVKG